MPKTPQSKSAPTTRTRNVLEFVASDRHQVDREQAVIRGVKILGQKSRNGGMYTPQAMATARPLYEGARVFLDHPVRHDTGAERRVEEMVGWLEGVAASPDGLRGDLHLLKSHPQTGQVLEMAERCPGNFGLSHNASVQESSRGGESVYESITCVRSVDIVTRPATNRGIFESESAMDETIAAPAPSTGGGLKDMILAKISEILDGDGDPAAKAAAIKAVAQELLKVEEKLDGATAKEPARESSESSGSPEKTESLRVVSVDAALDILESVGVVPTKIRVKALSRMGSPDEAKTLAESWKSIATAPAAKPRSSSVLESQRSTQQPESEDCKQRFEHLDAIAHRGR